MISYLLNTILFSATFWLVYQLLLKKETFFQANRIYLLAVPVLALVLPLLAFDFFQFGTPENPVFQLPIAVILNETASPAISNETATAAANPFSIFPVLAVSYALGVLVSLVLFVLKFRKLNKLKKIGKQTFLDGQEIIAIPNSSVAFSFFDTIFLGENYTETEKNQILNHEKVHVQQKHSWDLFYFELLRIVLWFNPFVYLIQKNVSEVHEFLADKNVSETASKKAYAQTLLNAGFDTQQFSFANSFFNHSSLKTRLIMLHKKSSTRISKLKFLAVIPLVFLMLVYVACSEDEDYSLSEQNNAAQFDSIKISKEEYKKFKEFRDSIKIKTNKLYQNYKEFEKSRKKYTNEVPFQMLDKFPEFPNSSSFKAESAGKKGFSDSMRNFVNKNFDVKKVKSDDIKGKNNIYVQFRIGKDGKIQDVRARNPHPELRHEAKRLIEMLPQMKPGEKDGKPVSVLYTLPIIFHVD